jgi:hypothetical protein
LNVTTIELDCEPMEQVTVAVPGVLDSSVADSRLALEMVTGPVTSDSAQKQFGEYTFSAPAIALALTKYGLPADAAVS